MVMQDEAIDVALFRVLNEVASPIDEPSAREVKGGIAEHAETSQRPELAQQFVMAAAVPRAQGDDLVAPGLFQRSNTAGKLAIRIMARAVEQRRRQVDFKRLVVQQINRRAARSSDEPLAAIARQFARGAGAGSRPVGLVPGQGAGSGRRDSGWRVFKPSFS